jgi:hypothetical protein
MSEEDEERERFIDLSRGVKQDAFGQFWRYSSFGSGNIPGWHPAMLGRRRGKPQDFMQDLISGVIFLSILLGIPAVALFTPRGFKLVGTVAYVSVLIVWVVSASAVAQKRARSAEPHAFPHPGPKGRHRHR